MACWASRVFSEDFTFARFLPNTSSHAVHHVIRCLYPHPAGACIHPGKPGRLTDAQGRPGLTKPGPSCCQVLIIGKGSLDEFIQSIIVENPPPLRQHLRRKGCPILFLVIGILILPGQGRPGRSCRSLFLRPLHSKRSITKGSRCQNHRQNRCLPSSIHTIHLLKTTQSGKHIYLIAIISNSNLNFNLVRMTFSESAYLRIEARALSSEPSALSWTAASQWALYG